ncbi:sensor histidine kinase [Tsukamurella soli]|uniref:histidine kinase n=1 Tax=Tsukamurella soli TaxID=644556 RepID=A0ABP8JQ36_9ACTN
MSLRVRVAAAAAAGTTIIALVVFGWALVHTRSSSYNQMDERLSAASATLSVIDMITQREPVDGMLVTARIGTHYRRSVGPAIPAVAGDYGYATIDGQRYRVHNRTLPVQQRVVLSTALPTAPVEHAIAVRRRQIVGLALASVAAAWALAWMFGTVAAAPIRRLATATRDFDPDHPPALPVGGTGEVGELSHTLRLLLTRVSQEQTSSARSLAASRDFAAAAAHELRSPLTAMRTDLEVLDTMPLDDAARAELVHSVRRAHDRMADTVTSLESLALGDLVAESDFAPTDLGELLDRVAADAARAHPDVVIEVDAPGGTVIDALAPNLRTAVRNGIENAVRHGGARRVVVSAGTTDGTTVSVAVDDDGGGLPLSERVIVFERFRRGSSASTAGSGLGLALVRQTAEAHGGAARLVDSDLGGLRLELVLPGTHGRR